jgi:hypothetical protein
VPLPRMIVTLELDVVGIALLVVDVSDEVAPSADPVRAADAELSATIGWCSVFVSQLAAAFASVANIPI